MYVLFLLPYWYKLPTSGPEDSNLRKCLLWHFTETFHYCLGFNISLAGLGVAVT